VTDVEPSPGPAQFVVLGMHRSGTSGVTRLLNLAGAHFGPEGIATEANEENPRGFWERRDVRAVCDGLLHGAGFDWWKLVGFDAAALPAEVVAPSVFSVAEPEPPQATTIGPMTNSEASSSVRVSEEVGIVVRFSRRDEWPVAVRRRR